MTDRRIMKTMTVGDVQYEICDEYARNEVEKKVSNPTAGAVGQILEIDSVDENGVPASYKATNKPVDGASPTVTVSEMTDEIVITIKDKNGTTQTTINKINDSGWITFREWNPETEPEYGNRPMQYRKIGKVVYIRGGFRFSNDFLTRSFSLGTIPEECRPSQDVSIVVDCLGDEDMITDVPCVIRCQISTTGSVEGIVVPTSTNIPDPFMSGYFHSSIDCSYVVD